MFGSFDPRFRLLLRGDGDVTGGFRLVEEDADIVGLLDELNRRISKVHKAYDTG